MTTHPLKPRILIDVFDAHHVDPHEPLPHGLAQVGMSGDWDRSDVLTLGALMDHPERYLVVVECEDCKPSDSGGAS